MPIYKAFDEFDFIFIASVVILTYHCLEKKATLLRQEDTTKPY